MAVPAMRLTGVSPVFFFLLLSSFFFFLLLLLLSSSFFFAFLLFHSNKKAGARCPCDAWALAPMPRSIFAG